MNCMLNNQINECKIDETPHIFESDIDIIDT